MILQSVKMAWKAVLSNKMRSFLTMLGIIIGVMSLVVLVSLAGGTTDSVNNQIASMGSNLLTVTMWKHLRKMTRLQRQRRWRPAV